MGIPAFAAYLSPAELEHACAQHLGKACLLSRFFLDPCMLLLLLLLLLPLTRRQEMWVERQDTQKDVALATLFSAVFSSHLSVIVVMTTAGAMISLLIKCQIYARCCRQNSQMPLHCSPIALRPLLSSLCRWSAPAQPMLTGLWGHLDFPIPENRAPGQLAAKLPFPGKAFCSRALL